MMEAFVLVMYDDKVTKNKNVVLASLLASIESDESLSTRHGSCLGSSFPLGTSKSPRILWYPKPNMAQPRQLAMGLELADLAPET
jgi:hypothetical protein